MPRTPFILSKSEGLLIGRCFEFYFRANERQFTTPLSLVIQRYLKPFLPCQNQFDFFDRVNLPNDVDYIFLEGEGESRSGMAESPSTPAAIYIVRNGVNSVVSFGRKKKFLDQLLVEWLKESLPTSYEHWFYSPQQEKDAFIRGITNTPDNNAHFQAEDYKKVADEIEFLFSCEQNTTVREFFDTGRILAQLLIGTQRVLYDIQQFQMFGHSLTGCEEDEYKLLWSAVEDSQFIEALDFRPFLSPSEWATECFDNLCKLAEIECVNHCTQSRLWLEHLIREVGEVPDDVNEPMADGIVPGEFSRFICLTHGIRGLAMLLQGELCGRYSQEDNETIRSDALSFCPRMLRLSTDSQIGKVHGSLSYLHDHFFTSKITNEPGLVVTLLKDGIEAITKLVWPSDFTGKSSLSEILKRRIDSEKGDARILAQTAMHLHRVYRNPATHEFNSFNVTLGQAYAFVGEMRVMAEIADSILKAKTK